VVDDVLTTGATTDAVATVLKGLGAERVVVWAVARATLDAAEPRTTGTVQAGRPASDQS
jgi:adenine/guanine phosphoribosyltransferase-like PRPP-binding protein